MFQYHVNREWFVAKHFFKTCSATILNSMIGMSNTFYIEPMLFQSLSHFSFVCFDWCFEWNSKLWLIRIEKKKSMILCWMWNAKKSKYQYNWRMWKWRGNAMGQNNTYKLHIKFKTKHTKKYICKSEQNRRVNSYVLLTI